MLLQKWGMPRPCVQEHFKREVYYPAASMYTMPKEPNYAVKFNFRPNFYFFPQDFVGFGC
jgi:hypothetical protein